MPFWWPDWLPWVCEVCNVKTNDHHKIKCSSIKSIHAFHAGISVLIWKKFMHQILAAFWVGGLVISICIATSYGQNASILLFYEDLYKPWVTHLCKKLPDFLLDHDTQTTEYHCLQVFPLNQCTFHSHLISSQLAHLKINKQLLFPLLISQNIMYFLRLNL